MGGGGKIAIGGIGAIIVIVIGLLTGKDFSGLLSNVQSPGVEQSANNTQTPANDTTAQLVKVVLASTEDVWGQIFSTNGQTYNPPTLVMFTGSIQSGCGGASSAMGPFYCPADHKVYIDLSFCNELRDRFRAPGSFAVAYVVAHEVGHHIQNLLGISEKIQRQRSRLSEADYNKLSVKLELQADFLAGVWAYHANKMRSILEPGDLEAALTAANSIGDDKLQKEAQGYTVPDAFTHGTSQQRMYWFKKGFESGDINQGKFEDIR
jgi:predicted metalloprotease